MAEQATMGGDFDELWLKFEGQKVTKVILNFAGEVEITDREVALALGYLSEVDFTIRGRVTGKKHSYAAGTTRGQAIITVESVELGGTTILTRQQAKKLAREEADMVDVTPVAEGDAPVAKKRGRPKKAKDPVWDEIDRQARSDGLCGKMHRGHLNPCAVLAVDCDLPSVEELEAGIAHAESTA